MTAWLLPVCLLLALLRWAFSLKRQRPAPHTTGRWKLLRDDPADWREAVYQPKGFRRRK